MEAVDRISGTVLWDLIIHKVYDDLVVLRQYLINDCNIMIDAYEELFEGEKEGEQNGNC